MIFKSYKIKKAEYSNLPDLLDRIGLVKGNEAAPGKCAVSKKTYRLFEKALYKLARKQYPFAPRKKVLFSVGMELLNLGPVRLDNGIEFGYIIAAEECMYEKA